MPFDFKVTAKEYAKMLFDLTIDGGTVLLLNDFARPPSFSREEAEAVGFNIVRWDTPRPMPALSIEATRQAEIQRGYPPLPSLGDLRLFVLRKGTTDASKVRTEVRQAK